jgi:hypothetical protein
MIRAQTAGLLPESVGRNRPLRAVEQKGSQTTASRLTTGKPPEVPHHALLIGDQNIRRNVDRILSLAISVKETETELAAYLAGRQPAKSASTHPQPDEPIHIGRLATSEWGKFAYILPKINCPDWLECKGDARPVERTNEPLVWDWTLSATKWDAFRSSL